MRPTRINSLSTKYTKELEASLNAIMPKLIEAFINIYGEKHKEYIENIINDIEYIFFISKSFCEVLSKYDEGISKKNRYIMKTFISGLNNFDHKFNSIPEDQEIEYFIKNYLTRYRYQFDELEVFLPALESDVPCFIPTLYEDEEKLKEKIVILLPIFTIDLKTIIHEINHALTTDIVGYTEEEVISANLFPTEKSEELVNDYIASLVLKEYLKIGGIIPKYLKRITIINQYEENDYIVKILFELLEPLILESAISKRYRLLYELVGRENLNQACLLIDDLYINGFNKDKYQELVSIFVKMYEKCIETKEIDYETYFQELESSGYRVRILNKN